MEEQSIPNLQIGFYEGDRETRENNIRKQTYFISIRFFIFIIYCIKERKEKSTMEKGSYSYTKSSDRTLHHEQIQSTTAKFNIYIYIDMHI